MLQETVKAFEELNEARNKVREKVKLMTMSALEERETIDTGLQRQLDAVLFEIAEQDDMTSDAVNMQSEAMPMSEASAVNDDSLTLLASAGGGEGGDEKDK